MNKKKNLWNHLLTALLIVALLMAQITPAFALEGEPTTNLAEAAEPATEPSGEPAADDGEGTDTPSTENPSEAPERPLTWGELITVFSRFTDGEPPAEVYTGGHWAKEAINTAISLEWIEYSEAFDPGGVVTCGEMVSFIQTVFQWAAEKT